MPRSEADLRALGLAWSCCESCHDDDALGYGMTERGLPDGSYLTACCTTPDGELIAAIIESRRLGREMEQEVSRVSAMLAQPSDPSIGAAIRALGSELGSNPA